MATRNNTSNGDLRDRVIALERDLKRTQDLVREDVQKLYKLLQETQKRGN
tara:strand:- start:1284 stop:1433 length:150 start_codon:yes stop_codon:yes gene_type:complete